MKTAQLDQVDQVASNGQRSLEAAKPARLPSCVVNEVGEELFEVLVLAVDGQIPQKLLYELKREETLLYEPLHKYT